MNDYNVTFSVDGSVMVRAESAEDAERRAIDALEGLDVHDTEDVTVDGCVVRVALEFTYDDQAEPDRCSKVERSPRVVEFAS